MKNITYGVACDAEGSYFLELGGQKAHHRFQDRMPYCFVKSSGYTRIMLKFSRELSSLQGGSLCTPSTKGIRSIKGIRASAIRITS